MWQLYTLGVGKFFLNLTFNLYEGHMIKNNFLKYTSPPPPPHRSSGKTTCYTAL